MLDSIIRQAMLKEYTTALEEGALNKKLEITLMNEQEATHSWKEYE